MIIAVGKNRKSKNWKNVDIAWDDLKSKLSSTVRTRETAKEYKQMSKAEQSAIKDVGGFVAGQLRDGHRKRDNVVNRTLITLDADFACVGMWDKVTTLFDYEMCCYSTHKHTDKQPRIRFIIPLARAVSVDEYEPISRMVAKDLGIDYFDITTHEACRLMYWPSTSSDAPFLYEEQTGPWLNPDDILARYDDWHNASEWPLATDEKSVRNKEAKKQGDPREKPGIVGLFCRTYDIESVVDAYLSDVYEPCDIDRSFPRYTFLGGSTFGGAVLYGDGQFIYSHHATDPAGGLLCNAFDLVRLHKFSHLDEDEGVDTPVNKLPSFKAMGEFVNEDSNVKVTKIREMQEEVTKDFSTSVVNNEVAELLDIGEEEEIDLDWAKNLTLDKKTGEIVASIDNIVLILLNDTKLKGVLAYNEFTSRRVMKRSTEWRSITKREQELNGSMWRDNDDSYIRWYLETVYNIVSKDKVRDAMNIAASKNSFNPVTSYLDSCVWDGVKRAETLLIDYMGAEDSDYVKVVTKTWLTGAVARAYHPGVKFDNVLLLVGKQGIGKSTLGRKLGGNWYSDTFTTVNGKEAFEQLRGVWIMEIGELSGIKKSEVEAVKNFISKTEDTYRAAYAENIMSYPRTCVFYATTNEDTDILKDKTGNRRWWPVEVEGSGRMVFDDLTEEVIKQVWAEVVTWYKGGKYDLYLKGDMAEVLVEVQEQFEEYAPMEGDVEEYLDKLIPSNWDEYSISRRRDYYQGVDMLSDGVKLVRRDVFSAVEFLRETCKVGENQDIQSYQCRDILKIMAKKKDWVKLKKRKKRNFYGTQTILVRKDVVDLAQFEYNGALIESSFE